MPSKRYALEPGGKPRLCLRWRRDFSELTALLDGVPIGTIEGGRSALRKVPELPMPEGAAVKLELIPGLWTESVLASRSGRPLPVNDPHARIRRVSLMCIVFGVVAMVIGALGVLIRAAQGPPGVLNLASIMILLGAVYAWLGYATRRWRSAPALGLAGGIFLALVAADWATRESYDPLEGVLGVALTILVAWEMWRGFIALGDAKQIDLDEPPTDSR